MKISTKRQRWRRNGFKSGHPYFVPASTSTPQPHSEPPPVHYVPRLTREDYSLVVREAPGGVLTLPDEEGRCTGGHLLRPRPDKDSADSTTEYLKGEGTNEMRILHREKINDMYNESIAQHNARDDWDCMTPQFELNKEVKWGLCWKQTLSCRKCNYVSRKFKLYDEVPSTNRGPKQAKPNLGFQIGLQECPMGNTKARVLLTSSNIPPPCASALHKASKKAAKSTIATAERDLKKRRRKTKDIYKKRGASEKAPIPIGVDSRYNSVPIAGRNKFGQNASQGVTVAIENQTDKKQIIAVYMENKLCYQGAWLRAKGYHVSCPGGHAGCSATLDETEPLSEYNMGMKLGEQLALDDIMVNYCCTDGDGRAAAGIQAAMSNIDPLWRTVRQADTTHLGVSLFKHARKAEFSDQMFPGTSTQDTTWQQQRLSSDLKQRCELIFQEMFRTYNGDIDQIASRMEMVIETTVKCYSGDCSDCRKHSVVCLGGEKSWRATSDDLRLGNITTLYPTQLDQSILRELIRFRLGAEALTLTRKNLNTNKNEAFNRSLSTSDPKNVNHSKTGKARVMSAVCRINKGAGNSLVESLQDAGCAISKGGAVAKAARQIQKRHLYQRGYYKRPNVKAARKRRLVGARERYTAARRRREANRSGAHQASYAKGQLDPPLRLPGQEDVPTQKDIKKEHSYFKHH